jgi:hypothetical protein
MQIFWTNYRGTSFQRNCTEVNSLGFTPWQCLSQAHRAWSNCRDHIDSAKHKARVISCSNYQIILCFSMVTFWSQTLLLQLNKPLLHITQPCIFRVLKCWTAVGN